MVQNVISPKPRNNFSELLVRIGSDADKQAFSDIFEHGGEHIQLVESCNTEEVWVQGWVNFITERAK